MMAMMAAAAKQHETGNWHDISKFDEHTHLKERVTQFDAFRKIKVKEFIADHIRPRMHFGGDPYTTWTV